MYEDKIADMIDTRSEEILEELGKTKMNESDYTTMTKNLETLQKINADRETRDQNRLNNNAKNELEEARLRLEEEKLKTQRLGNYLSVGQTALFGVASWVFCKISYNGDLMGMANRNLMAKANDMLGAMKSFFIRR